MFSINHSQFHTASSLSIVFSLEDMLWWATKMLENADVMPQEINVWLVDQSVDPFHMSKVLTLAS